MPKLPFEPKQPGMAGIQTPAASVGQALSNTPGMGGQMTPGLSGPADNGVAGKSMSPIGTNAPYGVQPPEMMPDQPPMGISGNVKPMEIPAASVVTPIGEEQAAEALLKLEKYRQGKAVHDARIIREEQWYRLQQGQDGGRMPEGTPRPTSAWMLSVLMSKHADLMDNIPSPAILPREQSDEQSARVLSDIIPAILDRVDFTDTYSRNAWDKLKFGTSCYGIFWDGSAENGLGDVAIRPVEMLNIFWEPGVSDIQKSANVFVLGHISNEALDKLSANRGQLRGNMVLNQYVHEDYVDTHEKSVVVDWYYKKANANGKQVLHFAKLVGTDVLYASENDPEYAETGWYDHGQYPFVFDRMTPQKDTPAGFGLISQQMDGQMYIDKLSGFILEHAAQSAHQRWWVSRTAGVNDEEFLDPNNILVHVDGAVEENRMKAIDVPSMGAYPMQVLQMKIDEMKETSANRDFNNGGTSSGVTAASAIYALQESGNKVSRAIVQETYSAYTKIIRQVIELVRQFYDIPRVFRIVMPNGMAQYVPMSNASIKGQPAGILPDGTPLIREPVFDIKVAAQKRNPFSTAAQNELALQLYSYGFFAPGGEQAALMALDMMTFEGKDKMVERLNQNMMRNMMMQQMQAQMMAQGGAPQEQAEEPPADGEQQGKRPYMNMREAKQRFGNG